MKILVTGGRDFEQQDALWLVLHWLCASPRITSSEKHILIHGACGWDLAQDGKMPEGPHPKVLRKLRGADRCAHLYGLENPGLVELRPYPADWSRGPSGGPKRNLHMFVTEHPHVVVAAPGGRGTADMLDIARSAGTMILEVTPWR